MSVRNQFFTRSVQHASMYQPGMNMRNSGNFEKLLDEDFNHMMLCTMHPSSSNAPSVRDMPPYTGEIGVLFGDSN